MFGRCIESYQPCVRLGHALLLLVSTVLALHGFALPACGDIVVIKELEFDVDGELPSAQSDIVYYSTGLPESSAYSVTGGLLSQRTINGAGDATGGNHSYVWPDVWSTGGTLNSDWGTILEARLRVNAVLGQLGVYFAAYDGAGQYSVSFAANNRIDVVQATGITTYDLGDYGFDYTDSLVYRLESLPNSDQVLLHVGGVHIASFTASTSGGNAELNGFGFGDGISSAGNAGSADWDYLRVYQVNPVPEPSSFCILLVSFATLGICRFRRQRSRAATIEQVPHRQ